ncbi:MAG: hypothetical protein ACPGRX_07815 [Bdellovibrionales bacterium]
MAEQDYSGNTFSSVTGVSPNYAVAIGEMITTYHGPTLQDKDGYSISAQQVIAPPPGKDDNSIYVAHIDSNGSTIIQTIDRVNVADAQRVNTAIRNYQDEYGVLTFIGGNLSAEAMLSVIQNASNRADPRPAPQSEVKTQWIRHANGDSRQEVIKTTPAAAANATIQGDPVQNEIQALITILGEGDMLGSAGIDGDRGQKTDEAAAKILGTTPDKIRGKTDSGLLATLRNKVVEGGQALTDEKTDPKLTQALLRAYDVKDPKDGSDIAYDGIRKPGGETERGIAALRELLRAPAAPAPAAEPLTDDQKIADYKEKLIKHFGTIDDEGNVTQGADGVNAVAAYKIQKSGYSFRILTPHFFSHFKDSEILNAEGDSAKLILNRPGTISWIANDHPDKLATFLYAAGIDPKSDDFKTAIETLSDAEQTAIRGALMDKGAQSLAFDRSADPDGRADIITYNNKTYTFGFAKDGQVTMTGSDGKILIGEDRDKAFGALFNSGIEKSVIITALTAATEIELAGALLDRNKRIGEINDHTTSTSNSTDKIPEIMKYDVMPSFEVAKPRSPTVTVGPSGA